MELLTQAHDLAPKHVKVDDTIWPVGVLVDRARWDVLAAAGVYRHVTEPGNKGHAGYSDWVLTSDGEGPLYSRYPISDVTEPGEAPLGYTEWELRQDAEGRDYYYREPAGTEAERLEALKERKRNELYQRRVEAEKSSFQHTDGRWYDGGDDSIERFGVVAQQITWALMAGALTETVVIEGGWRDVQDVGGPATIAEVQALLQSHYAHGVLCEQTSQTHKAAINAATTIDELNSISLIEGWPTQ